MSRLIPSTIVVKHRATIYWSALAVTVLVAFLVRIPGGFSPMIQHDELYHYFAGLSFVRDGTLAIGEGRYGRAAPYTMLTGLSLKAFGNDLIALRFPAIVSGTLMVAAVSMWLGRISRVAGVVGGALLALDFLSVQLSDYARFYTLHALMVWLAAVGGYALITQRHRPVELVALVIGTIASLALALNLQVLTLFAVVAFAAWAVTDYALFPHGRLFSFGRGMIVALICIIIAAIIILLLTPLGTLIFSLYAKFWHAAQWAEKVRSEQLFYLRFMRSFGLLTYLFPFALMAAWRIDRRRTLFCAILFAVPVLIASIGPQKAPRYIFYCLSFFLSIWALASAWVLDFVYHWFARRGYSVWPTAAVSAVAVLVVLVSTTSFRSTLGLVNRFVRTGQAYSPRVIAMDKDFDWRPWMPMLRRAVPASGIIVGVDDLRTLYFFGRIDVMLNRTIQWDISRQEFVHDRRTGVPAISAPESIRLIIDCTRSGAIIVPQMRWREYSVIPATADVIEQHTTRVNLPAKAPFRVYRWQKSRIPRTVSCQRLASRLQ